MTLYVKNSGVWVTPKKVFRNNAGTWQQIQKVFLKNAGNWVLQYVNVTISANTSNYNLFTAVGSPANPVTVYATINNAVEITSTVNTTPAFTVGAFPAGSKIYLVNNGYIVGKGGNGIGKGYVDGVRDQFQSNLTAPTSGNGGTAFSTAVAISIDNTNGVVGGGGGAGGSGGSTSADCSCTSSCCSNGSVSIVGHGIGGGGAGFGAAGTGSPTWWDGSCGWVNNGASRSNPTAGTPNTGNAGTLSAGGAAFGTGGAGGTLGVAGATGSGAVRCSRSQTAPGTGGAAGDCTSGNSNITWVATGNRYGALN